MGWEGKARRKEEPETKTGKQIRGALTIRLSNRHGRADIILFRFIAPKGPQPHDHRLRRHPHQALARRPPLQAARQRRLRRAQDPRGHAHREYGGQRISAKEADRRHPTNPDDPFHTFFFALSSGRVIDGGDEGNDARWINHSCEPNCEAQEGKHGKRVYIVAVRDIARGEELSYDYGLVLDGRITRRCATATAASAARRRVAAPCWRCRTSRRRRRRSWPRPGRPRRSPWPERGRAHEKQGGSKQAVKPGAKQDALLDAKPDAKPAAKQDAPAQANGQAATKPARKPARKPAEATAQPEAAQSKSPPPSAAPRTRPRRFRPRLKPHRRQAYCPVRRPQAYNQPVVNTTCSTSSGRGEIPHRRYATQCGEPASARCSPGTPGSADLVRCQGRRS